MENKYEVIEKAENKAVMQLLIKNTKKKQWITGNHIAEQLKNTIRSPIDYNDVHIREIIKRLRRKNIPVIACGKGYKLSTDSIEIARQAASLRARAKDMLYTARSLDVLAIKMYNKQNGEMNNEINN